MVMQLASMSPSRRALAPSASDRFTVRAGRIPKSSKAFRDTNSPEPPRGPMSTTRPCRSLKERTGPSPRTTQW
jgi:hypothetical protein